MLTHAFTGTVEGPPATWLQATLSPLVVGDTFSATIATDGMPAPTYTITAGALPDGLTLNQTTGLVAGTPTTAGAVELTLTATGSDPDPIDVTTPDGLVSIQLRGVQMSGGPADPRRHPADHDHR